MNSFDRISSGVIPLLNWYGENARDLPWRRDITPYRVWVSEIMLQQTRVAAVLNYFPRFLSALPDIRSLADCPEEQLLKLWQGLGYYSRARNLQKAAKVICTEYNGVFPDSYDAILSLPGIGEYTAGAIASIAFSQPVPAVDGNVIRVTTRLLADERDITKPAVKRDIRSLLSEAIPLNSPGTFNQALMELGALVCLPNGEPRCEVCPWKTLCLARAEGKTGDIPVRPPKKARKVENRTVFLILYQHRIALRQRPEKGLLAGLWELPNEEGSSLPLDLWHIIPLSLEDGGSGIHIFTHIEWHMTGMVVRAADGTLPAGWVWADSRELEDQYPIPNAFSPFRERIEEELQRE